MRDTRLVLIKFKVWGNLRFLSHAETVKVFQRACVRAGPVLQKKRKTGTLKIQYSQGFNPHPRMSLPLPRSVGVESDDDLLCLQVEAPHSSFDAEEFKTMLSEQLPEGCELLSVSVAKTNTSFQPCLATYVLTVRPEYLGDKLKTRIEHLLASESLNLKRRINTKNSRFKIQDSRFKNVDVRPFLKSIKIQDTKIVVECRISSAGSIRVDEILKLLELDVEKLAAPIRRTSVQFVARDS